MEYNQIDGKLKEKIVKIVNKDQYGLNPESLYNNIKNSTGTEEKLATLYDIPVEIVKEIKSLQK